MLIGIGTGEVGKTDDGRRGEKEREGQGWKEGRKRKRRWKGGKGREGKEGHPEPIALLIETLKRTHVPGESGGSMRGTR